MTAVAATELAPPSAGEIHLWPICASDLPQSCELVLDEQERHRSLEFVRAEDRAMFVASRAAMRILVARYLHSDPSAIAFALGPHGKPHIASAGETALEFNISHSGGLVVLAFATGVDIGVDVERIRPLRDAEMLVRAFFTPAERARYWELDPADRIAGFFRAWTRKEAILKASGVGLSMLDEVDVPLRACPRAEDRSFSRVAKVDGWDLIDIELDARYQLSIAIGVEPTEVRLLEMSCGRAHAAPLAAAARAVWGLRRPCSPAGPTSRAR